MTVDRKAMARTYRLKSEDSWQTAQGAWKSQCHRSVCNRAWYAVMQLITAAVYEDLKDLPGDGRPNWSHERQSSLFRSFLNKHKAWQEHKELATEIDLMRERRNDSDYYAPTEFSDLRGAERSLETAAKVRSVIFSLIGERWNEQLQPDDTEEVAP